MTLLLVLFGFYFSILVGHLLFSVVHMGALASNEKAKEALGYAVKWPKHVYLFFIKEF